MLATRPSKELVCSQQTSSKCYHSLFKSLAWICKWNKLSFLLTTPLNIKPGRPPVVNCPYPNPSLDQLLQMMPSSYPAFRVVATLINLLIERRLNQQAMSERH